MMNVLALSLILTTLVTAGVFSPTPPQKEDVIVKEGHRVVVVEFEKDDGNTKVLISPAQDHQTRQGYASNLKDKINEAVEDAKEKVKEASSSLPNVGQGVSSPFTEDPQEDGHRASAREIVCDAFGKCKHRIASALGKGKDVVSEAEEAVSGAIGKVRDSVTHKSHEAFQMAEDAAARTKELKETVEERAKEAAEKAKRGAGIAKEAVKETAKRGAGKAEETVKETAEKAKRGAEDVIDTTKTLKGDVARNASAKVSEAVGEAGEVVENAKQNMKNAAHDQVGSKDEGGKKELREILREGREVLSDVFAYVAAPESLRSCMGVVHLLGFAMAYGMSVWVTFLSSYVLAGALPRQQFAVVQSKIYPVYFRAMAYSVGIALLGHVFSQRKRLHSAEMFQGFNLLSSLAMILINLLYLEPRASKVMFERLKWEKEEGRGRHDATTEPGIRAVDSAGDAAATTGTTAAAVGGVDERPLKMIKLSEALKKLNSYSSFLNVLTLVGLTLHLVPLGHRLHTAC